MAPIQCEVCGSNSMTKRDGFFQCDYCKTKYTLPEMQKMLVSGTVSIQGNVSVRQADFSIRAGVLEQYNGTSGEVAIPESVSLIERKAFAGCRGLRSVKITGSVQRIEGGTRKKVRRATHNCYDGAFTGCENLRTVEIQPGVTVIEYDTFRDCPRLTTVRLPEGLTIIEEAAFDGCLSLKELLLPDGVTSIGSCAFRRCTSLTRLTIPGTVTEMGGHAFAYCDHLTDVILSENCPRLAHNLLMNATSLVNVTIPQGVAVIGEYAFANCLRLSQVTIPDSVTQIAPNAFQNCPSLQKVRIHGGLERLSEAFKFTPVGRPFLRADRIRRGVCTYCGDTIGGIFHKRCNACGRPKDY